MNFVKTIIKRYGLEHYKKVLKFNIQLFKSITNSKEDVQEIIKLYIYYVNNILLKKRPEKLSIANFTAIMLSLSPYAHIEAWTYAIHLFSYRKGMEDNDSVIRDMMYR